MHCTTLSRLLQCTEQQCTLQQCTAQQYMAQQCTAQQLMAHQYTALHNNGPHFIDPIICVRLCLCQGAITSSVIALSRTFIGSLCCNVLHRFMLQGKTNLIGALHLSTF